MLGKVKTSNVASGYTDNTIDKLVGKQEVVYGMCVHKQRVWSI